MLRNQQPTMPETVGWTPSLQCFKSMCTWALNHDTPVLSGASFAFSPPSTFCFVIMSLLIVFVLFLWLFPTSPGLFEQPPYSQLNYCFCFQYHFHWTCLLFNNCIVILYFYSYDSVFFYCEYGNNRYIELKCNLLTKCFSTRKFKSIFRSTGRWCWCTILMGIGRMFNAVHLFIFVIDYLSFNIFIFYPFCL